MQHYEMMYIIAAEKAVTGLDPIKDAVKKIIAEHGGEITSEQSMDKLKLAYPIKKVSYGYYEVIEFNVDSKQVNELNHTLGYSQDILRHLIVTKQEKTVEQLSAEKKLKEKITKAKEEKLKEDLAEKTKDEKEVKPAKVTNKISLEDLDKKLDELLDDKLDIK